MNDRLERLYARRTFGIKPGLDEIRALLRELGDPQESFRVLHVAGTDGKGSVSTMLASVLRAAGVRAGLYTSPHLVRLSERFRIDGAEIPDGAFFALLDEVEAAAARLVARGLPEPTFFETTTALCALWFAREGVKLAVAEVGMGGRLDATNAFLPAVSVVTRIGMDHMQYLGDTIGAIAREKAGIAKPGVPVVLGANEPAVREVVSRRAAELGAPFVYAPDLADESEIPGGFSLGGAFNRENAVTALAVLRTLEGLGTVPTAPDPCVGFNAVYWPGRYQRLGAMLVDGAHNPPAAAALAAALRADGVQARSLALVAGFCGDKDVDSVLNRLSPLVARGYAVQTSNPRSLSAAETAARMRAAGIEATECASLDEALALSGAASAAKEQPPPAPRVLVAGSLFLAGEALASLGAISASPARRPDPSERLSPCCGSSQPGVK